MNRRSLTQTIGTVSIFESSVELSGSEKSIAHPDHMGQDGVTESQNPVECCLAISTHLELTPWELREFPLSKNRGQKSFADSGMLREGRYGLGPELHTGMDNREAYCFGITRHEPIAAVEWIWFRVQIPDE